MILSVDSVYPRGTGVKITVEGEYLAPAKVPISSEVKAGTEGIDIARGAPGISGMPWFEPIMSTTPRM